MTPEKPATSKAKTLTDTAIRTARPREKVYRLDAERGLWLEITPEGGKRWRFRYRFGGKEKLLSMGLYPDVGLAEARDRRDEARKLVANGVDPSAARKAQKAAGAEQAANSFEVTAREWFAQLSPHWAPSHASTILRRLEVDLFPWLGGRPVAEITALELLPVLQRIAGRGTVETAHRARNDASQVFRYAIAHGRATRAQDEDARAAPRSPVEAGARRPRRTPPVDRPRQAPLPE